MQKILAVLLLALSTGVLGQGFPNKPIRLIAPFAPGGALDLIARGLGTTPIGSTPESLAAYQRSDIERWTKVVKTAGIKPE